MKIGILGGSFNPIHNEHLSVAKQIIEQKIVSEVWFMPCKKHALDKFLDKEEDRVAMVKLAIKGLEHVKFCDLELKKQDKSYTYDSLRKLKQEYKHDFLWIIGSDILKQIPSWYGYEHLQKEASFIVLHREGYEVFNPGINMICLEEPIFPNISSTKIRYNVRKGKSISSLVPKAVEDYIKTHGLYLN